MKILIHLGHPAHFHLVHYVIQKLQAHGHSVHIVIKTKDVLSQLLDNYGFEYINLMDRFNRKGQWTIARDLFVRLLRLNRVIARFQPDIMVGSTAEIAILGKLRNIPSLVLFEDDLQYVPAFARLAGPTATRLICPQSCSAWKWEYKTFKYDSYHEMAYLAPFFFTPDRSRIEHLFSGRQQYYIIRFSELNAYHDSGVTGITDDMALQLIHRLQKEGTVHVVSERELSANLEPFRIKIDPIDIHHALYFAHMYLGDSQTMAAEAAVLGTPALRYNDFVGKLGYLEELEHRYQLTYGFKTDNFSGMINRMEELLAQPDLHRIWQNRRAIMLNEKIDLTSFLVNMIESYS